MEPLIVFFFPGVSHLVIVPLQLLSHQRRANTTTTVACGRINIPHRRCGISTLTATMTVAAMAALSPLPGLQQQPSLPPQLWHGGQLFFPVCTLSLSLSLIGQFASSLLAIVPLQSWSHQGCASTPHHQRSHINTLDLCCHRSTSALTTTMPTSAPLQQGSSCGSTVTVTMTVALPSPLLYLWQHPAPATPSGPPRPQ
jgi:hypothetical protein